MKRVCYRCRLSCVSGRVPVIRKKKNDTTMPLEKRRRRKMKRNERTYMRYANRRSQLTRDGNTFTENPSARMRHHALFYRHRSTCAKQPNVTTKVYVNEAEEKAKKKPSDEKRRKMFKMCAWANFRHFACVRVLQSLCSFDQKPNTFNGKKNMK